MDHHKDECKELKQAGQLGDDMNVMIGRILRRLELGDDELIEIDGGKFQHLLVGSKIGIVTRN